MMIPMKLCSEVKGYLTRYDRSMNWLVISGRSFHVSCESDLENNCIAYLAEMRGAKLLVLRTLQKRRLVLDNESAVGWS